jgi:putative ABC transport system permease protein
VAITRLMRARHRISNPENDDFTVRTVEEMAATRVQMAQTMTGLLMSVASVSLLVGGIGIMNIMLVSVTERTREIGVRKALGARRREILVQFLIEAVVLTSIGGLLGVVLGSAIGYGVNVFAGFPVSLPWWSFALGLGFSSLVGIFFGMWPAMKASRLDPIEALRYE